MTTGQRIRSIRLACGFTQAKLAEKMHISPGFQSRIENGSSNITLHYVQSVSEILGVTPQEILCDLFVYPEDSSTAEQVTALLERMPQEDQNITLDTLRPIINRLYAEE